MLIYYISQSTSLTKLHILKGLPPYIVSESKSQNSLLHNFARQRNLGYPWQWWGVSCTDKCETQIIQNEYFN
jgi:hypothetical protein